MKELEKEILEELAKINIYPDILEKESLSKVINLSIQLTQNKIISIIDKLFELPDKNPNKVSKSWLDGYLFALNRVKESLKKEVNL